MAKEIDVAPQEAPAAIVGHSDRVDRAERGTFVVYRSAVSNVAIAVGLAFLIINLCREVMAAGFGGLEWSWRVPIAATAGSLLIVRALRRGVIVSPFGIEVRRLLTSWRAPWSVVESAVVDGPSPWPMGRGRLVVTFVDGSTRELRRMPCGGPKAVPLHEVVMAARGRAEDRPRSYLGPNWFLTLFMLSGMALIVAIVWDQTARSNLRLYREGQRPRTTEQLGELLREIRDARFAGIVLLVAFIAAGVMAIIWAGRARGLVPTGPWPRGLAYPSETDRHRLDTEQLAGLQSTLATRCNAADVSM